jgi:hypothetical protein
LGVGLESNDPTPGKMYSYETMEEAWVVVPVMKNEKEKKKKKKNLPSHIS